MVKQDHLDGGANTLHLLCTIEALTFPTFSMALSNQAVVY